MIDHIGKFLEPVAPDIAGISFACCNLLDTGRCWVKLSAPYETSKTGAPKYEDVGRLAKALVKKAPERMLWASNWPHPSVPKEQRPSDEDLLDLLLDWAPRRIGAAQDAGRQSGGAVRLSMKRVALVGLGMAVTPHAKSLLDLKDRVQVAYAYSPSDERRKRFAERFAFPQCSQLETILQDRTVDAVLVLAPPNTHLEIASRCAAAGKHVLLEKPLEISTARAEQLVRACKNVKLGVVLQHRFRPAAEKLREKLPRTGKAGLGFGRTSRTGGRRATTTSRAAAPGRATAAACC